MEVQVMVMVEDLSREESPTQALSALFTMVALDGDGKATKAPALEVLTEEERRLFEEGKQRYLERKRT